MKVGGGLNYVTGPMGAGKSLYATRRIVEYVVAGKYAITNVELTPGWEYRVARHVSPLADAAKRDRIARRLRGFYVYETELAEAMLYDVPGKGEARALFIWDEGHNDLNNRNWRERAAKYANEAGADELLEWATQLRKLGFVGFLLSQHQDNTDAALRRVCNHVIRLQNQREQTRLLGLRVTPWPLFLAAWYPAHLAFKGANQLTPVKVERYFLGWHRNLYDTMGVYHGVAEQSINGRRRLLPVGGVPVPEVLAAASGARELTTTTSHRLPRPADVPRYKAMPRGTTDDAPRPTPQTRRPPLDTEAVTPPHARHPRERSSFRRS